MTARDPVFPAIHSAVRGRRANGSANGSANGQGTRPGRRGVVVGGKEGPDAYEVLGIDPNSTLKDVRGAYRKLAQQYHPDRFSDEADHVRRAAEQRMSEINAAYTAVRRMLGDGDGKLPTGTVDRSWMADQKRMHTDRRFRTDRYSRWEELERLHRDGKTVGRPAGWWAPAKVETEPASVRLRREREARRAAEAARWKNSPELQERLRKHADEYVETVNELHELYEQRLNTKKRGSIRKK